jgi:hypothetical protein
MLLKVPNKPAFLPAKVEASEELIATELKAYVPLFPRARWLLGLLACAHRNCVHFTWRVRPGCAAQEDCWAFTGKACVRCWRVLAWQRVY